MLHVVELVFSLFEFLLEKVDHFDGFLLNSIFNTVAFRQVVKSLKHFHTFFHSHHALKCESDHFLIHYVKVLHSDLECIELIMPWTSLYVQDFILLWWSDLLDTFSECYLYLFKNVNDLRTPKIKEILNELLAATELWNRTIRALARKLKLSLTNFFKLNTTLKANFSHLMPDNLVELMWH